MAEPAELLAAARRILNGATRDLEMGLHESAGVSAQRAGVLATEAWLRAQGQTHIAASVHENVCLSPAAGNVVREAAARLDRWRIEEGFPHRSAGTAPGTGAEAELAVADGRLILAFVERDGGLA